MTDRPLVAITRRLVKAAEDRVAERYAVKLGDDSATYTPESLAAHCAGAVGLLITPTEPFGAETIKRLDDSVRVISTVSVGFEHIDLNAAKARGIRVGHTPGVLTDATADTAALLILGATRRASDGERLLRSGAWIGIRPTQHLGMQITGKSLGIYGLGRIGFAVAQRMRAFGMKIIYHDEQRVPHDVQVGATFVPDLDDMLAQSDVVSLHAPLTPQTKGIMNAARIARMKDGAVLVNTARGPLVDDDAVIAAVKSGKLFAIGLDVYAGEPAIDPRYKTLENAFLFPHLGTATLETRSAMMMLAIDNLEAVLDGKEPRFSAG
ncbi:MAG: 2-hydroxyacid dehydrogenase [Rhodospirillaceae bacterium]